MKRSWFDAGEQKGGMIFDIQGGSGFTNDWRRDLNKRQHIQAAQGVTDIYGLGMRMEGTVANDWGHSLAAGMNPGLSSDVIDGGSLLPLQSMSDALGGLPEGNGGYLFAQDGKAPDGEINIGNIQASFNEELRPQMVRVATMADMPCYIQTRDCHKKGRDSLVRVFNFIVANYELLKRDNESPMYKQMLIDGARQFEKLRPGGEYTEDDKLAANENAPGAMNHWERRVAAAMSLRPFGVVNNVPDGQIAIPGMMPGMTDDVDTILTNNRIAGRHRLLSLWDYTAAGRQNGSRLFLALRPHYGATKADDTVLWLPHAVPPNVPLSLPEDALAYQLFAIVKIEGGGSTMDIPKPGDGLELRLDHHFPLAQLLTCCAYDGAGPRQHAGPLAAHRMDNARVDSGISSNMRDATAIRQFEQTASHRSTVDSLIVNGPIRGDLKKAAQKFRALSDKHHGG